MSRTFCEFFAGIGLVHAALARAGWCCGYANDLDPAKRTMYLAHFGGEAAGEHYHLSDVWDTEAVLARLPPEPKLATASFPCTDLSLAGKQLGFAGEQSSAFFGFARVLERLGARRPPLVLLENVVGFLTAREGRDFARAVQTLAELGYWLDAFVLDAVCFTPQSRPRMFVVGVLGGGDLELEGLAPPRDLLGRRAGDAGPHPLRPARLRAAIAATRLDTGWLHLRLPAPPAPEHCLEEWLELDDAQPWWPEPQTARHEAMLSERHRAAVQSWLASGERRAATAFRRIRQGQQRLEVRLDGLAGCLRTPRGGSARQIVVCADAGRLRMRWMTPREYAKLQGAPDFPLEVSDSQALFGFGDAVCVPAVEWVAENVLNPLAEAVEAADACRAG